MKTKKKIGILAVVIICSVIVFFIVKHYTSKTPQEYFQEIVASQKKFQHTPMPQNTTTDYEAYLAAMSEEFFGEHCDYYLNTTGNAFQCVVVDSTLSPYSLRTALMFAPSDDLYQQVATGKSRHLVGTMQNGINICVKLPKPEEMVSWNVWTLLCVHEEVHVNNFLRGKNSSNQVAEEILPYLAEKNALKEMNSEWYDDFMGKFVSFYKAHGFCPEMLEAINVVFQVRQLSQIEQVLLPGAIMIFIAMEAENVESDDVDEMEEILSELNIFLSHLGAVQY